MKLAQKYGKPTSLALSAWVKLARAYTTFSRGADKSIASFGLTTPQFAVLECLGHLGAMTIGTLTKKMLVSGGNMTVVIDNLERTGLVVREPSAEDRRAIKVRLTEKGEQLFAESFSKHAEHIARLASVLTEEELTQLSNLLKKLGHKLAGESR